jgi:hypothetical protein
MSKNELYYLILVCAAFGGFGLALAASYLQYRGWLSRQAPAKTRK